MLLNVLPPPHCVNPVTVAKGKKLRLVVDLRHVNKHVCKQTFCYEDLKSLSQLFGEKYWFFKWDLKSGYHHVNIYPPHRQFLGFSWTFSSHKCYFVFIVLFSLTSVCHCFTKLLHPLIKRWRSMSHASFVYLDDGIFGHSEHVDAVAASLMQKKDLTLAGFVRNDEKCHLQPMQVGEWLGLIINTVNFHFEIPPRKIEKAKKSIEFLLFSHKRTVVHEDKSRTDYARGNVSLFQRAKTTSFKQEIRFILLERVNLLVLLLLPKAYWKRYLAIVIVACRLSKGLNPSEVFKLSMNRGVYHTLQRKI